MSGLGSAGWFFGSTQCLLGLGCPDGCLEPQLGWLQQLGFERYFSLSPQGSLQQDSLISLYGGSSLQELVPQEDKPLVQALIK